MVRDGAKLVAEGKMAGLGEKILATLKGTPKRKLAIATAVAGLLGWGAYERLSSDSDVSKEAQVYFAKYKDKPAELDKALAENRKTFDQETKNECLKYAVAAKLGLDGPSMDRLQIEYRNQTYVVQLPVVMEKQHAVGVLASLKDSLSVVEPQNP